MPTDQIVALLIAERDKLNRAIEALQGGAKRRGRPPRNLAAGPVAAVSAPKETKAPKTPAQIARDKAQSARMKAYWAKKKKAAKK